jgi:putative ABC transport system ATP-binding protein
MHDADFAHRIVNLFDGQIITEVKKQMGEVVF